MHRLLSILNTPEHKFGGNIPLTVQHPWTVDIFISSMAPIGLCRSCAGWARVP